MEGAALDEAIASARPPARRREAVLASVRARLFGGEELSRIDRYVIERRLGAGGMGVVWAARDPRLDRRVAIKVLRGPERRNDRARLLREAQALARLSHPNVVEIYDVGVHGEQVYLAMELVDGQTLASWLEQPRPWREVLALFIAAGRGLEAAHAVELVHRDFKPGNVMLGRDGRVRVMDFGLAYHAGASQAPSEPEPSSARSRGAWLDAELTTTGQRVGTPAYMAPEQHDGGVVDARTDQFGFAAALYEALVGAPPFRADTLDGLAELKREGRVAAPGTGHGAPSALLAVVRRGLAPDPAARHAGMRTFLAALERFAARRSRRVLAIAALSVAAAGSIAWSVDDRGCADAFGVERMWGSDGRQRLSAAFGDIGASWSVDAGARAIAALDRHANAWVTARAHACSGLGQDDELRDRAHACLERDRERFAALVGELTEADASGLGHALGAAGSLEDPARCVDVDALARGPAALPPADAGLVTAAREQLARAWALQRIDRFEPAREVLEQLELEAERIGDPALQAEVWFAHGNILLDDGDPGAEELLRRAYFSAREHGHATIAAEAATMLVFATGTYAARPDEGFDWARHAEAALAEAALAEAPDVTLQAELDTSVASLLDARGEHERARARYRSAIAALSGLREDADADTPLQYLALSHAATGELDTARELLERAIEQRVRRLGAMHVLVAHARVNFANVLLRLGALDEALEQHRIALGIQEAMLGPRHVDVGVQHGNLGSLLDAMGDGTAAREHHLLALELLEHTLGADHPYVGATLVNLGRLDLRLGELDRAQRELERARSVLEPTLGAAHPHLGFALLGLGELAVARGDSRRALAVLGSAELACGADEPMLCAEIEFQRARAFALLGDRLASGRAASLARERAGVGHEGQELRSRIDSWARTRPG